MTMTEIAGGRVVPFARWHVIHEVDLVRLVARHEALARLCDALEACADALPAPPPADVAAALCDRLEDVAAEQARAGDAALAGMFGFDLDDPLTAGLLGHIRAGHIADAAHAQDLAAALRPGADARSALAADALAYLLHCFFAGCRSTMRFEALAVFALARHRLSADARALLAEKLCRRAA